MGSVASPVKEFDFIVVGGKFGKDLETEINDFIQVELRVMSLLEGWQRTQKSPYSSSKLESGTLSYLELYQR